MTANSAERFLGSIVKKDIFNRYGMVIIPKGIILEEQHLKMLYNQRVMICTDDVDFPIKRIAGHDKLIAEAAVEIREVFSLIRINKRVPIRELEQKILPSVFEAAENPSLYAILLGLQAKDDYTYRHNIGVAVLSTMLGKWLKVNSADLSLLTLAASLHDVGKIYIDDKILNMPGRYSDEEYIQMKQHTTYGYDILRKNPELPERVALVALQHHEREDGKGYPYGITGGKMDYFSKIVAVADIFHAMTSNRVYRKAIPFQQVIVQMMEEGFGKLDPAICNVFIRRIMEMAVGSDVVLTDGRRGKIILINNLVPSKPLVQVESQYVDLSKEPCLGLDYLAG